MSDDAARTQSSFAGFGSPSADPLGFALIMTPMAGGCLAWGIGIAFPGSPPEPFSMGGLFATGWLVVIATAVLIGFDAPRTRPKTTYRSPLMIAIGVLCLWLVAYPRYVYLRDKVASPKRFWAAIVAVVVFLVAGPLGAGCGAALRVGHQ